MRDQNLPTIVKMEGKETDVEDEKVEHRSTPCHEVHNLRLVGAPFYKAGA